MRPRRTRCRRTTHHPRPMNPDMVALANADPAIIPITQNDILKEQRRDHYCRTMMSDVGKSGTQFEVNRYGLLCPRASAGGPLSTEVFQSSFPPPWGHAYCFSVIIRRHRDIWEQGGCT